MEGFRVAIVKGKDVQKMVEEAVDKVGGIKNIVPKGSKVMLKPNLLMATNVAGPLVTATPPLIREGFVVSV